MYVFAKRSSERIHWLRRGAVVAALGVSLMSAAHAEAADPRPGTRPAMLDLTAPAVQQLEAGLTWGCSGGSLTGTDEGLVVPPALPLGLHVLSLNGNNLRLGEVVTFEIALANSGHFPVRIPWSVDAGLVFDKKCRWLPPPGTIGLHGNVALVLMDESGQKDIIGAHGLFGISSQKSTFRELASGETVLVKTAGRMELYNIVRGRKNVGLPPDLPITVSVTATYTLDETPAFGGHRPVVSSNSLRITIVAK